MGRFPDQTWRLTRPLRDLAIPLRCALCSLVCWKERLKRIILDNVEPNTYRKGDHCNQNHPLELPRFCGQLNAWQTY